MLNFLKKNKYDETKELKILEINSSFVKTEIKIEVLKDCVLHGLYGISINETSEMKKGDIFTISVHNYKYTINFKEDDCIYIKDFYNGIIED